VAIAVVLPALAPADASAAPGLLPSIIVMVSASPIRK
jgi:hypothetical protein